MALERMYREKPATGSSVSVAIGRVIERQSPMTATSEVDWLASKLKIGNVSANTWIRIRPGRTPASRR